MFRRLVMVILAAVLAAPLAAQEPVDARAVVEQAVAAHGGEAWLEPGTLVLSGSAVFYSPDSAAPRSTADDYRMWRVLDPERNSAHGAEGKVRITARSGERVIFEVGYDGAVTWNERGIVPKAEADAFWATNFGFGIIRSALREDFALQSAPGRQIDGRPLDMIRVTDPGGQETLFGFDRESRFIRYMAFRSPRGFHERLYDDFVKLDSGWVQARNVTLLYDGVVANVVTWAAVIVGEPIDPAIFAPPAK